MTRSWSWLLFLGTAGLALGQDGVVVRSPQPLPAEARPELVLCRGHAGAITALVYAPGGQLLTGGSDGSVACRDGATGRLLAPAVRGHTGRIVSLVVAPNGRQLASVGGDGTARLWQLGDEPEPGKVLPGDGALRGVAFSPDGLALALGGEFVYRYAVATGAALARPEKRSYNAALLLGYTPDGALLLSADRRELMCGPAGGGPVQHFSLSDDATRRQILWAALSPRGDIALVLTAGTTLWRVAMDTGRRQEVFALPGKPVVVAAAMTPDGQRLVLATGDGRVRLWELATGEVEEWAPQSSGVPLEALAIDPSGRLLAGAARDGRLRFWDLVGHRQLPVREQPPAPSALSVAYRPGTNELLVADSEGAVRRWDPTLGEPVGLPVEQSEEPIGRLSVSANGRWLLTSGKDSYTRLWDLNGQRLVGQSQVRPALDLAVSDDGRRVMGAYPRQLLWFDSTAEPWDWTRPKGHVGDVCGVAYSGTSGWMLSAGQDGSLRLWTVGDEASQRVLYRVLGPLTCVAWSPDEETAAVGRPDGRLLFYNLRLGGDPVAGPQGHRGAVSSVSFSPDGQRLVSAGEDGRVLRWNVATQQIIGGRETGPGVPVRQVAWSPDGRQLASAGGDGATRLWDAATGEPLALLYSFAGGDAFLTLTPGGYYHGSMSAQQYVRWRLGGRLYPYDEFAERYLRPDLVRSALAGKRPDPGLDQPLPTPPNIAFALPAYATQVRGTSADVELQVAGLSPIRRIDLTVDGRPVAVPMAKDEEDAVGAATPRTVQVTVPLPVGEYQARLRAVAYAADGGRSRPAELLLLAPNAERRPSTLHVLAIGLNRYERLPERYQLRYAAPDAEALAARLATFGEGRPYAAVEVTLLLDTEATLDRLRFALRELKDAVGEGDAAVIFISGHGLALPDGSFYFPSYDLDLNDVEHTALSSDDFIAALAEVRAKRTLVLADTCHSGGIVGERALNSDLLAARLNREAHQMVLTAAARYEASVGTPKFGHGLFTQALLEALLGVADIEPADGQLTFAELSAYVTGRVAVLSNGRQHPQLPFLDHYEPDAVFVDVTPRR